MIAADQSLARSNGRGVNASISLKNVEKVYGGPSGDLHAIAPLSIELPAGEAVSIVGPSGCGKSTLMRLIAGLDAPTRGEIRVGHQVVAKPVPDIGIVFQRDLLLDWRKVLGNVLLPAEIKGLSGLEGRARELLQEFDVGAFADSYPWQLSGGMRTLLITHSITEAIFCADRVLVMSGRPGAIMDDIRVPFERPRRLAIRETTEFTSIGRRIREHFEKVGVLVG